MSVAQTEAPEGEESAPSTFLEEVVVTGAVRRGVNRLESSVTTTSIGEEAIGYTTARTSTEIFRSIPGIRVEASGGDNNANIQVRGTPLSEGGAKYVQLQEDGLPILAFGDVIFGNSDGWLRVDSLTGNVEAIRGGAASTVASNAPGAIINVISRTGEVEGGSVALTRGLGFDSTRFDFDYGGNLNDAWRFQVGGFYRVGEGPRDTGFNAENGGQARFNITREFDDGSGFIRFSAKFLDDRVHANLPQPLLATGTDGNPGFGALPGFDASNDTLSTPNLGFTPRFDGNEGQFETTDYSDGFRSKMLSLGLEFERELGSGYVVNNKFRWSEISGQFTGLLTLSTFNAVTAADDLFPGEGVALRQVVADNVLMGDLNSLNGNGLITSNLLFDVDNDDLGNWQNDLRISKSYDFDNFLIDAYVGYYKMVQDIEQDWFFNEVLLDVRGGSADRIDVLDANGNSLTDDGFRTFGIFTAPVNDLQYDRDAIYGGLALNVGSFSIDGSVRYERVDATGFTTQGGGDAAQSQQPVDINQDGTIGPAEGALNTPILSQLNPVNYTVDYTSWSLGGNYLVNDQLALFARYSEGASANADRLVAGAFGGGAFFTPTGDLLDDDVAVDRVEQFEAGIKWNARSLPIPGNLALFLTYFNADTEENTGSVGTTGGFDFSIANQFEGQGVEFEGRYTSGRFDLTAGVTYSDSEFSSSDIPEQVGATPQRNADLIYQITPVFHLGDGFGSQGVGRVTLGSSIIGTTSSFTRAANVLELPGFTQVNFFAEVRVTEDFRLNLQLNNAFDEFGVTEAEEAALANGLLAPQVGGTIIRGRPINGRTFTISGVLSF